MALFLVTQYPKPKCRAIMVCMNVIVDAGTKAQAVRQAVAIGEAGTSEKWFSHNPDYCAPKAIALKTGIPFTS